MLRRRHRVIREIDADGNVRQRWNVQRDRIADHLRPRRNDDRVQVVERQCMVGAGLIAALIGGSIGIRSETSARAQCDVRRANVQRLRAEPVRQPHTGLLPANTGMHNLTQCLAGEIWSTARISRHHRRTPRRHPGRMRGRACGVAAGNNQHETCYRQRCKTGSQLMRDAANTPLETQRRWKEFHCAPRNVGVNGSRCSNCTSRIFPRVQNTLAIIIFNGRLPSCPSLP